jgi:hypothetical protein
LIDRITESDPRGIFLWLRIKYVIVMAVLAQAQNIMKQIVNSATDSHWPPDQSKVAPTPPGPALDQGHRFFHLLGIDILLNDRCDPWVLELNDRPSMGVTDEIEHSLKTQLVRDALNLVTADGSPPGDEVPAGAWEKIFPDPGTPLGREGEQVLARCLAGGSTPQIAIAKRLGYMPSAAKLHRPYRRSLVVPHVRQQKVIISS